MKIERPLIDAGSRRTKFSKPNCPEALLDAIRDYSLDRIIFEPNFAVPMAQTIGDYAFTRAAAGHSALAAAMWSHGLAAAPRTEARNSIRSIRTRK